MKKILFVCTGNICRSPTAEAIFRNYLLRQGTTHDYKIDSCGTHSYHIGKSPDPRAIKIARRHGIDISMLLARQIQTKDFHDFDHIIAMDEIHLNLLNHIAPSKRKAKISLFSENAINGEKDIPDPYYGTIEDFEKVFQMLQAGMENLYKFIRKN